MQISSALSQAATTGVSTQPMSAAPTAAPAPTGDALSMMGTVTTVHFALLALLALLTIALIVYGVRQRARRRLAEREEQARIDSLGTMEEGASPPLVRADAPAPLRPVPRAVEVTETPEPVAVPRHDPLPPRGERVVLPEAAASLTRIKGLGPKVANRLAELGITRVDQLAMLTDDEAEALDAQLGAFRGRIARDRWVEQARFLAAGDVRGFEAVFGRL